MTDNDQADADEESDLPTIELTPEHELDAQDPYEPPNEEELAEHFDQLLGLYSEEVQQDARAWATGGTEADGVEKMASPQHVRSPYERADDALLHAIQRSSWWVNQQYNRGTTLSKAPGIWRYNNFVPESVRSTLQQVISQSSWGWVDFEALNHTDVQELVAILDGHLTQPGGWTISELAKDLQATYSLEEDPAAEMAADTVHGILNITRERVYKDLVGSEGFRYKWVEPRHCTAPVYNGIREGIEKRGGAVTMSTLRSILMREARQSEGTAEGEGTPQYVAEWMPYRGNRATFVRQY